MMNEHFETLPISDLRPTIAFHYTDMAMGALDYYLRESAIRFSRLTKILRRTIRFDYQKGVNDYILSDLPDGYILHEISEVRVDGQCIDPVCDRCKCLSGKYKHHAGKLEICYAEGCEVEVDVIVMPSRTTCNIDADIINQWGDVIANGANAKLMMSNDKRWQNIGLARQEEVSFLRGVEEAQIHVQRGGITDKVWNAPTNSNNKGYSIYSGQRYTTGQSAFSIFGS
jgi:hypothetical protein